MPLPKHERMTKKLLEQLNFIQRSCEAYDKGFEDEAIRVATSLRIIFHQTTASTSLITHLKFGGKKMLSSSRGHGSAMDYLSWVINMESRQPVMTRPILGTEFRELYIKEWWNGEPVFVCNNQTFTRRNIILSAANKDGGTHVDEKLEKFYEALIEGLGDGISITGNLEFNGEPWFEQGINHSAKNAHLALIRQFAHEAITSINHFNWLKNKS